jgi:hypothetical protein
MASAPRSASSQPLPPGRVSRSRCSAALQHPAATASRAQDLGRAPVPQPNSVTRAVSSSPAWPPGPPGPAPRTAVQGLGSGSASLARRVSVPPDPRRICRCAAFTARPATLASAKQRIRRPDRPSPPPPRSSCTPGRSPGRALGQRGEEPT